MIAGSRSRIIGRRGRAGSYFLTQRVLAIMRERHTGRIAIQTDATAHMFTDGIPEIWAITRRTARFSRPVTWAG